MVRIQFAWALPSERLGTSYARTVIEAELLSRHLIPWQEATSGTAWPTARSPDSAKATPVRLLPDKTYRRLLATIRGTVVDSRQRSGSVPALAF